jgi:hypothetical protein
MDLHEYGSINRDMAFQNPSSAKGGGTAAGDIAKATNSVWHVLYRWPQARAAALA